MGFLKLREGHPWLRGLRHCEIFGNLFDKGTKIIKTYDIVIEPIPGILNKEQSRWSVMKCYEKYEKVHYFDWAVQFFYWGLGGPSWLRGLK